MRDVHGPCNHLTFHVHAPQSITTANTLYLDYRLDHSADENWIRTSSMQHKRRHSSDSSLSPYRIPRTRHWIIDISHMLTERRAGAVDFSSRLLPICTILQYTSLRVTLTLQQYTKAYHDVKSKAQTRPRMKRSGHESRQKFITDYI
jgi:hypothetical protein